MQLGLSSYTYPWAVGVPGHRPAHPIGVRELAERTLEAGLSTVQYADNLPLHLASSAELHELDALRRRHDMTIELGARGIGAHLIEYAELAELFGSAFVRLVVDEHGDHPTIEETIERLAPFREPFERRALTLAIENHDRFLSDELIRIVETLGPWTGICLDTANSLGCLEPPSAVATALAPHAVNLHVKDFTIRRHESALGFEVVGTPAGSGRLDVPWLLDLVGSEGRAQSAILELWTPPQGDLGRTIATEAAWADESVAYLLSLPQLRGSRHNLTVGSS